MEHRTERQILLTMLNDEITSQKVKDQIIDTFPTYMPYKGVGFIAVDNVEKAENVLKAYFEENHYDYERYNDRQDPFFFEKNGNPYCYGKFEIHDINLFMKKLIEAGIAIEDYHFETYESYYN